MDVEKVIDELLSAPCKWCGYNGMGYWQAKTHKKSCPWYAMGGGSYREEAIQEVVYDLWKYWPEIQLPEVKTTIGIISDELSEDIPRRLEDLELRVAELERSSPSYVVVKRKSIKTEPKKSDLPTSKFYSLIRKRLNVPDANFVMNTLRDEGIIEPIVQPQEMDDV